MARNHSDELGNGLSERKTQSFPNILIYITLSVKKTLMIANYLLK